MDKVLVICGPTCVGKTAVSIELAKILNGEIINGDSMQVYKEMNIGTAKITEGEKEGIPHHLFDIKTINESFSVAEFQTLCREKIKEITSRGKLPIIVGGTGLYLKAALYDYVFLLQDSNRNKYNFDDKTTEELYNLLSELDPRTAENIHFNNRKRIERALEIFYESGVGKQDIVNQQEHKPIYDVFYLGLTRPREKLYELIDKRVDIMVSQGLVTEVKHILDNASPDSTSRQAIGYKEFLGYFSGDCTLDESITLVKRNTRQFAKRQYTWFNHQVDVNWIEVEAKNTKEIAKECINALKEWN